MGLATDMSPEAREITHFTTAENVSYQVSGSVRKVGGSQRMNGTAIGGSPGVVGIFDFWRAGSSGTATQQVVVVDSTGKIFRLTASTPIDISGTVAFTVTGSRPVFCQFQDLLTIWSSAGDAPRKWNQSGAVELLAGAPPSARVATVHKGRIWAGATNANPSRLFFSTLGAAEIWTGNDTGAIDIDPEDGDRIVGLTSHKGDLLIFKGPYKGSIHRLLGSAPTGSDAFSLEPLIKGVALQTQNSIVDVGDDVWFMSDRGVHSLSATQRFGNFTEGDLSRFLRQLFAEQINRTLMDRVWGVHYPHRSCVIWTLAGRSGSASANNDMALVFSYIRQQEESLKVSTWYRSCLSAAIVIDPATLTRDLAFGTSDGFIERQDITRRALASPPSGGFILGTDLLGTGRLGDAFVSNTAYNFRIVTPQISIADTYRLQDEVPFSRAEVMGQHHAEQAVILERLYLRSEPLGPFDVTIRVSRDGRAPETYLFNQGATGFVLGTSLLDADTLSGATLQIASAEMVGEARAITLDVNQGGTGEDAHLFEIGLDYSLTSPAGSTTLA